MVSKTPNYKKTYLGLECCKVNVIVAQIRLPMPLNNNNLLNWNYYDETHESVQI